LYEQEERAKLAGEVEGAQTESSNFKYLLETYLEKLDTIHQEKGEKNIRPPGESECLQSFSEWYHSFFSYHP
jgi:hypothetical protein